MQIPLCNWRAICVKQVVGLCSLSECSSAQCNKSDIFMHLTDRFEHNLIPLLLLRVISLEYFSQENFVCVSHFQPQKKSFYFKIVIPFMTLRGVYEHRGAPGPYAEYAPSL